MKVLIEGLGRQFASVRRRVPGGRIGRGIGGMFPTGLSVKTEGGDTVIPTLCIEKLLNYHSIRCSSLWQITSRRYGAVEAYAMVVMGLQYRIHSVRVHPNCAPSLVQSRCYVLPTAS